MTGGYKRGETAGDYFCIQQFAVEKNKRRSRQGNKKDCKYVESTEQSNAPAEPTERACWHCWLGEKDINHWKAALRPFATCSVYKVWTRGSLSFSQVLKINIQMNSSHWDILAEWEMYEPVKVIGFVEMCQMRVVPRYSFAPLTRCCLTSSRSEKMLLWACATVLIRPQAANGIDILQTDHL